jgi:alpha-beta hydrolase superfamily lysophospholipase
MRWTDVPYNWILLVGGILVVYLLLVLVAYLLQDRMLYFPDVEPRQQTVEMAAWLGLALWPDAESYYGLVSAAPPLDMKGTVLVWHGNGGSALHRVHYVRALERLGYRVVLLEYPGYGSRPGERSEASFVADARAATRLAKEAFGGPLYAWGESLGCGVASAVAADPELEIAGAAMITPWDTLPDLAQRIYWYLPARWIVRDRYDNIRNLSTFDGPVAVMMAEQDGIIPNVHTLRLYEALSVEKGLWVFQGAGHNTWPTAADAAWWAEAMVFLAEEAR